MMSDLPAEMQCLKEDMKLCDRRSSYIVFFFSSGKVWLAEGMNISVTLPSFASSVVNDSLGCYISA